MSLDTVSALLETLKNVYTLTPVGHVGENAIGTFVVRDRVDVAVTPSRRLDLLILIVGWLHFELLEHISERHFDWLFDFN